MSGPADYRWLAVDDRLGSSEAGCVTVVTGMPRDEALGRLGAQLDVAARVDDEIPFAAPMAGAVAISDVGVVIVEPAGFEGARAEVLRPLSKRGAAATVQWDVNGGVVVAGARKGRLTFLGDLLVDEDVAALPARLRKLLPDDPIEADLVAVGAAMIETFTGVGFDTAMLGGIDTVHPVVPVMADLLQLLPQWTTMYRRGATDLLEALLAAGESSQRRLAEWCAVEAVRRTEQEADERLAATIGTFGRGGPARPDAGLTDIAQQAARELALTERRDPFKRPDRGPSGVVHAWAWQRKAAIDAVRYCCETDARQAVLGAPSAMLGIARLDDVLAPYLAELRRRVGVDPANWGSIGSEPLPGPLTQDDRDAALAVERIRLAEFEAEERGWQPPEWL